MLWFFIASTSFFTTSQVSDTHMLQEYISCIHVVVSKIQREFGDSLSLDQNYLIDFVQYLGHKLELKRRTMTWPVVLLCI